MSGSSARGLLVTAAAARFGERWQVALAKLLSVQGRSIRRWHSGERGVPGWALVRLRQELMAHSAELRKIAKTLPKSAKPRPGSG